MREKKQKKDKRGKREEIVRACLDTVSPLGFPIQMAFFLSYQNIKVFFTAETVAQRSGPIFAKQGLIQ